MGAYSNIEWTTHTFNPWWGCTKVSDGCKFCYAEALSHRYGYDFWGPQRERRILSDQHWQMPLRWNADAERAGVREQVFCASMADVFDERAPEGQLERLWHLIRCTPHLDWQLLTKRPHLAADKLPADWGTGYENVWLGTSIEDERVLDRIQHLVALPSVVRFLSVEPLIGPIKHLPLIGINWVIVGGESGARARPMRPEWVQDIQRQCDQEHVAFFFKQWGGPNKKKAGRELEGTFYNEMPQRAASPMVAPFRENRKAKNRNLVVLND